ncbi:hypothetical protein CAPTEDRAFT_168000 [Capitella teleta]|uniref:HECT domain-containing protein n=1 Tax=Capitella teleta TaxID=283909 RepID=R7UEF7_CAPTE|nr:hypothetical protein CAPTEDRAFT_168000 [Capitella teleta]|eukprot:ELU04919.1 hypothetical protein CAPTEDRAFT_168000 [Capitella teleta]
MEARKRNSDLSSKRLARIRCLKECVECLRTCTELPKSLAYVPQSTEYRTTKASVVSAYAEADSRSRKVLDVACLVDHRLLVSAEEFCNGEGQWARLLKAYLPNKPSTEVIPSEECWLNIYRSQTGPEDVVIFSEVQPAKNTEFSHGISKPEISTWKEVVEANYSVGIRCQQGVIKPSDEAVVDRMRSVPTNWTLDHDEELAQFLASHTCTDNDNLGSIKNYVESISVSTFSVKEGPDNLTDGSSDTYWESDGNQGLHWVRLKMKKGTTIKKLVVTIDGNDDNYMPSRILVFGGQLENLVKLNTVSIDQSLCGLTDVTILEDQMVHHPWLEIRIKECKDDGIDTRIHGLKIKSSKEMDLGLNSDLFKSEKLLVRYPKIEGFPSLSLYSRGLLLLRFISLLDSVLSFIIPSWEFSVQSFASLEVVRQFLPLSKKRIPLIETFLRESETGRTSGMPKLYINRRAAADHKIDPSLDPDYKNSIFHQIYEGLKPRDKFEKVLDYRWPSRHDQWWECKFIAEGIVDQGGGFRDSLSDIAEELCPSDNSSNVPLPLFIRSPNQKNMDANVNRDVYIPNPSCQEFHHYEWIGKLMGACLRGKENLVLSLPSFVWKKLGGEHVKWERDFVTVDEAEVKVIENMVSMDEDNFSAFFGEERTWTTVLSDGTCVSLKPNGTEENVAYADRQEYCSAVQVTRMAESEAQISAISRGLLQVVPQAVLDLLTWQELERRICGDPEISLENLRRATHYEDLEEEDDRVKHFWGALGNFSNEDRSRLLRFITGRRRLPAPLFICPEKGRDCVDTLPESSTCANTLYLPNYSSPEKAEEKLRYAAYNCIAIDTDISPWDE